MTGRSSRTWRWPRRLHQVRRTAAWASWRPPALELDFVPLDQERYDLVIPVAFYESNVLAPLLAIVRDPAFAARVAALGGYATPQMGQILAEIGA